MRPSAAHKKYAELELFTEREIQLHRAAVDLVNLIPYLDPEGAPVRCHELARAVGHRLELTVQDGHYGYIEHTWLWTEPMDFVTYVGPRHRWANIIDVYAPGRLPSMLLIDGSSMGLPLEYRYGNPRTDIRSWDWMTRVFDAHSKGVR